MTTDKKYLVTSPVKHLESPKNNQPWDELNQVFNCEEGRIIGPNS